MAPLKRLVLPRVFVRSTLAVLAVWSLTAHAQTPPDAGQVLRETVPGMALPPSAAAPASGVQPSAGATPEVAPANSAGSDATLIIKRVRFSGNQAFSEAELQALVADLPERPRSLAELQQAAARVSQHYRAAGYLVARAYLPKQQLQDGALTIAVLEGQLAAAPFTNNSRLDDDTVEAFLARIPRNTAPRGNEVNRAVLLLGDLPGAGTVDARLAAGERVGETLLKATLGEAPMVQGRVEADNSGGLYTGRYRAGGSLALNSALGFGERFSARLLASNASLVAARLAADLPLGANGLTGTAAVGRTSYELGDTFEPLDAGGRSDTAEFSLRYPLVRGVRRNVYAQLGYEHRSLKDEVRSTVTETRKRAQVTALSLFGDGRDAWLGGGLTQASVTLSSGQLKIRSAEAAELDAVAARTAGSYSKWAWSLSRLQAIAPGLSFSASLRGQQARKNLDSSEKFSLGGPGGVRAYASGEASGDQGWLGSLELQYRWNDHIATSLFHDRGRVSINAKPYLDGSNTAQRSGSGLGLQGLYREFDWRLTLAWRGAETGTAETDKKLRVWLQAGWRF